MNTPNPMRDQARARFVWVAWLLVGLTLGATALSVGGCSKSPRARASRGELSAQEQREAQGLYEQLVSLSASGQEGQALAHAYDLLDRFPGFEYEDHVLLLGGKAARDTGDGRAALALFDELTRRFPDSEYVAESYWNQARIHDSRREWLEAAEAYTLYWEHSDDDGLKDQARARLKELIDEELNLEEIEQLRDSYPDTVIGSYVSYVAATRRFEASDPPETVGPMLEDFLVRYPDSRYREDVESMLAELKSSAGYQTAPGIDVAYADRIGVLCPLTGEYAALGQAMYNGALLAMEEHNRENNEALQLLSVDTRGDGVQTVLAARSLIDDEGALAIVGALLSPTTIAAAVVCQERGVPLVSPTATQESISELGDYVFQTNLTRAFETRLVAQVAVQRLLKRRLAILYPDSEEGRSAAHLFSMEVERLGATVVASEPYDRGVTDYKEPLSRIRSAGPEALFIPAGPSEMRLIAPQLTFYQLETQLLGPSTWNNPRLAREVGDGLDRAIFPSDTAQMPQEERQRFQQLWLRRFHEERTNPFGLKTYWATRQVLAAISDGAKSRGVLKEELNRRLVLQAGGADSSDDSRALRYLVAGDVKTLPLGIFPPLADASVDEIEAPPRDFPLEGGEDEEEDED